MAAHCIAFRTDASSQIGTGHFMRCLTLADTLKRNDILVRFVSRGLPDYLSNMLTAKGIELIMLECDTSTSASGDLAHSHWLVTSQKQDAQATIQALSDEIWDWLIVDHYALDYRWESKLRQTARNILVIDDIADRRHDCDILLDQNFYLDMESRYIEKVPEHCQLLLGPRYALLREEFQQLKKQIKPRKGPVKRILVFFGGVDIDNFTGCTIEALAEIDILNLHIDVVIGAQHPCLEQIKVACAQHGYDYHLQTNKMAELMAMADLAIGAGGTTILERCAMGLPSIILVLADNQSKSTSHLAAAGILINLGEAAQTTPKLLLEKTTRLIFDERKRTELSKASLKLMTGQKQLFITELLVNTNAKLQ